MLEYTKKAILFAEGIGCKNLVFGCPKNRNKPEITDRDCVVSFFREMGDFAAEHHTVIAMEANPPIYGTNYINNTESACELAIEVNSQGFKLNYDLGTVISNGEELSSLYNYAPLINHIHISEPGLNIIVKRELHKELFKILREISYDKYVSLEMKRGSSLLELENVLSYISDIALCG